MALWFLGWDSISLYTEGHVTQSIIQSIPISFFMQFGQKLALIQVVNYRWKKGILPSSFATHQEHPTRTYDGGCCRWPPTSSRNAMAWQTTGLQWLSHSQPHKYFIKRIHSQLCSPVRTSYHSRPYMKSPKTSSTVSSAKKMKFLNLGVKFIMFPITAFISHDQDLRSKD